MPEVIAIIGSRDYLYPELVKRYVETLPPGTLVVSGGARGVDKQAELLCKNRGIHIARIDALWENYGKSAGHKRNHYVVWVATKVIAFHDRTSRGTLDALLQAVEMGKPCFVVHKTPALKPWPKKGCVHPDIIEWRKHSDGSIDGICVDCGDSSFPIRDVAHEKWVAAGKP